jgi:hypothetical protein
MALRDEVISFHRSIEGYKATDLPSPQLYDIFNAIVTQAHVQLPDSAVISAIKAVDRDNAVDIGTLRAATDQIRSAIPKRSQSVRLG